tara:strand:+ start:232 stop:1434 length:1203 start_codon:yes stop_codon:yes gene_type:complete
MYSKLPSLVSLNVDVLSTNRDDEPINAMLLRPVSVKGESDKTEWFRVRRDVKNDHIGMAVVAYTHQWDLEMVLRQRGLGQKERPPKQQLSQDGVASRRAMLLFFIPLQELQTWCVWSKGIKQRYDTTADLPASIFQMELASTYYTGAAVIVGGADAYRDKCELNFVYNPSSWDAPVGSDAEKRKLGEVEMMQADEDGVITKILLEKAHATVAQGTLRYDNKISPMSHSQSVFNDTVIRMNYALHAACEDVRAQKLYRGIDVRRVPVDSTPQEVAMALRSSFFSTSRDQRIAQDFVGNNGILVTFEQGSKLRGDVRHLVFGIDVNCTLPSEWRCFNEHEVVVAPGQMVVAGDDSKIEWKSKIVQPGTVSETTVYYRTLTLSIMPGSRQSVEWKMGDDPHFG